MVRNVTLFLAGLLATVLLLIEWPLLLPVVHILLGQ